MQVQLHIDSHRFRVTCPQNPSGSLDNIAELKVYLPESHFWTDGGGSTRFFTARIRTDAFALISDAGFRCVIYTDSAADASEFLAQHFGKACDLAVCLLFGNTKEDILWFESASKDTLWVMGITMEDGEWKGSLIRRKRPHISMNDFQLCPQDDEAEKLFGMLMGDKGLSIPDGFPCIGSGVQNKKNNRNLLTTKLSLTERWFVNFPLDYYRHYAQFGQLHFYADTEWLVTDKGFAQNSYERYVIRDQLKDVRNFLRHGIVIVNDYPHFHRDSWTSRVVKFGTDLVIEICQLLQNVTFSGNQGTEQLSVKYLINPTEEVVTGVLNDESIHYLFADFHVDGGRWQLGRSSNSEKAIAYSVDGLRPGALQHIQLGSLHHCYSVNDPYDWTDHDSITDSLLKAGAFRIEGSILQMYYQDFLCQLLTVLIAPAGLQPLVMGMCLETQVDYQALKTKVVNYMELCGYGEAARKVGIR